MSDNSDGGNTSTTRTLKRSLSVNKIKNIEIHSCIQCAFFSLIIHQFTNENQN